MDIPDEDHVMRHVSYKRLLKDEDGQPIGGFFPQAFQLKEGEKGLSVNWLEYFKGTHNENIETSVQKFRATRDIRKSSAFGISVTKQIINVCANHGADKVRVVLDEMDDNKSHSLIIRLPENDLDLLQSLAVNSFVECVFDSEIKRSDEYYKIT